MISKSIFTFPQRCFLGENLELVVLQIHTLTVFEYAYDP